MMDEKDQASNERDLFDPKALRIDPSSDAGSGVKKLLLHVAVRKPHRQEFFRVHPAPEYRETVAILELREEREIYIVAAALAAELATEIRLVEMRVCISRSGIVFLWAVPLPVEDGRSNAWHVTASEAAELAEAKWVRMSSNMGAGCYDVAVARAGFVD